MIQRLLQCLKLIRMLNFDSKSRIGPLRVDIAPTSACNYRCAFCGTHSYLRQQNERPAFLDGAILGSLLSGLSEMGTTHILFAGNGEPFLSPGMLEQVRRCKNDLRIEIMTNGSMLDRPDRETFGKISRLIISLNSGNGKSHQLVHGYKGENQYPVIVSQIDRLLNFPRGADKIELNYVVTSDNTNEVLDFKKLAHKRRVKYHIRPEDKRAFLPNDAPKRLHPCYLGFIQPTITANGSVLQCYGYPKALGNLNKQNFEAIWRRQHNRRIRFQAATMGQSKKPLVAGCYDCPNAIASSHAFHSVYSRLPFLARRVK